MEAESGTEKQVAENDEVQRELAKTTVEAASAPEVPAEDSGLWFLRYLPFLVLALALYYIGRLGYFAYAGENVAAILGRTAGASVAIVAVLIAQKAIRVYVISKLADSVARYNLNRVVKLLGSLAVVVILLTAFFANWYTAVVSLGLISLVLGFALQAPITSFFGWVYILVKAPYRVGDRIKIDTVTGDVIGVSYFDTTLWEFGGELLSTTNHPSGRIIKFPNSQVFSSIVHNYSWSLFPYIWNDIKFQIAYQSDLEFVAKVMREAAEEEVGQAMMERVRVFRQLLAQTPVDQLEVNERPVVVFRVSENTWIEAICRYLVEPKKAGNVKSRLIKTMLERLNAEPQRVMFPKADRR
jgi:small-conductance mechanosensitive channel